MSFNQSCQPNQVLQSLCAHDKRNPDYIEGGKTPCFCDNCFYGRSELANDLLDAWSQLNDYIDRASR
jgi:hypothetical protein